MFKEILLRHKKKWNRVKNKVCPEFIDMIVQHCAHFGLKSKVLHSVIFNARLYFKI